ncbi:MAG: glycerophosphodiester phosphodiesterase family protein [Planctomycetota bacterium]
MVPASRRLRVSALALAMLVLVAPRAGGSSAHADGPAVATRTRVEAILTGPGTRRHLVCGHRGDFRLQEGNNLPSFESAWRAGLDLIEIDVESTSDGVPVIVHDDWPRKKTWAEWQRRRKPMLTLANALAWAAPIGRPLLILDLKTPHLESVVATLRAGRAAGRVVAFASDEKEYHRIRFLMPELDVMVRAHDRNGALAWTERQDPKIVMIHGDYEWLHGGLCDDLRALGYRTYCNSWKLTWDDEASGAASSVGRVFRRGIDVAQTNHPPTAVAARNAANRKAGR